MKRSGIALKASLSVAMTLVCASVGVAQTSLPPAFPRTNATKLLETDRIVVWDIVWTKGQPTAMHRHVHDQVGTYYARGGRLITMPDGTSRSAMTEVGGLSTTRKGTTHIEEGTTDPPLRAVFIELKQDTASSPPTESPATLPSNISKQLLDDDRVTAWDVAWGADALKYHADRDTVIVWLGAGKARVVPQTGTPSVTDVKPGTMRYMTRGSAETVEMVDGSPHAILFQFK